jgi:hypothetical protein
MAIVSDCSTRKRRVPCSNVFRSIAKEGLGRETGLPEISITELLVSPV